MTLPWIPCWPALLAIPMFQASGVSEAPPAQGASGGAIRWEAYTTQGVDDRPLVGELGRLRVPENRGKSSGKTIEIAFVRFRTANPKPLPPLFYFVGGPGPSGIEHCVGPATGRMLRLLDLCDVIGIDQRGTGLSRPNLAEGPAFRYALPLDRPVTRAAYVEAYADAVRRCAAHWEQQGVDLSAYNSVESAADIEDVRRALGLERIITWGESYGTHLSLAFLRRHASHVERSVLIRLEGPDQTWKLPSTVQRHLEVLDRLVAADAALHARLPDFLGTVRDLLARLGKEPVSVEVSIEGQPTRIVLGPFDLQSYLAQSLGLAFVLRDVPDAVARMAKGDWSALAAPALELRRGEVGSAMALAMDCASGATAARLRRLRKEALDPVHVLGDAINAPYPDVCADCGVADLGDAYRGSLKCAVPVLFVSGDLDAKTPPENVDEVRSDFSRAVHVIARNAGHESIEMLSAQYRSLLSDFLHGRPVESQAIELPPPRFRTSRD